MDWNVGVYWMSLPFPRRCMRDSAPGDVLSFTSIGSLFAWRFFSRSSNSPCTPPLSGRTCSNSPQTPWPHEIVLSQGTSSFARWQALNEMSWTSLMMVTPSVGLKNHVRGYWAVTEKDCSASFSSDLRKHPLGTCCQKIHLPLSTENLAIISLQWLFVKEETKPRSCWRVVGGTFLLHWGFASEDWRAPGGGTHGFWWESRGGGARSGRGWGGEACIDRDGDENRPHRLYSTAAAVSRTWFLTGHRREAKNITYLLL